MMAYPVNISNTAIIWPRRRQRRNIPVSDGGHRHDGPVYPARNARKACVGPLDDIHERSHNHDDQGHGQHEDHNLAATRPQRRVQHIFRSKKPHQFEHAKHPQDAQHADRKEKATRRKYDAQERRQDGEKIHHTEETCRITSGVPGAVEPQRVFHRKKDGEYPLEDSQFGAPLLGYGNHAVQHDRHDTQQDRHDEHHVE